MMYDCLFFVFKQKTAYGMRISDWSSDVCSSDLGDLPLGQSQGCARFVGFTQHQIGASEAQPAVGVGRLGLEAGGELVDHRTDESLPFFGCHALDRLDFARGRTAWYFCGRLGAWLLGTGARRRLDAELLGRTP